MLGFEAIVDVVLGSLVEEKRMQMVCRAKLSVHMG
jgi:hypothetical protein